LVDLLITGCFWIIFLLHKIRLKNMWKCMEQAFASFKNKWNILYKRGGGCPNIGMVVAAGVYDLAVNALHKV